MKEPSFLKRKLGLGKHKDKDKDKGEHSSALVSQSSDIPSASPAVSSPVPRSLTPSFGPKIPAPSGSPPEAPLLHSVPAKAPGQAPVEIPAAPMPSDAAKALRAAAEPSNIAPEGNAPVLPRVPTNKAGTSASATELKNGSNAESGDDFTTKTATIQLEDGNSIPDKLSELLDSTVQVLQHLLGVGGYTMAQEILRWSMLAQIFGAVVITYFMASFHIWAVVTVPLMIGAIWLIWAVHLRSVTTVIRTQTRLDFILSGPCCVQLMPEKESAWWLNMVLRACWPIFLRDFLNRVVVPKLAPWFLNKYKPPVLLRVDVMNVDMGDRGPVVSNIRVLQGVAGDSHVELEMDIEVASADNMFIQCGAKVLGMSAITWEAFVTGMHLTGTIRAGLRFNNNWKQGFVDRVAVMFPSPPQLSCAIKVMGGLDAASMPLAAGYVEATLQAALNAALVWPNRILVVDAVKAVCHLMDLPLPESDDVMAESFSGGAKAVKLTKALVGQTAATAIVEILEGEDMIAADAGGTSDPYVKGTLGPARFTTGVIMKTLNPKWSGEKYELPVEDWTREESYNLHLKVRDYDKFSSDDDLGWAKVDLRQFRGGVPQEMLLDLQGVESGSLLIKVTIKDDVGLTDEEKQQLLEEKKAQATARARKLAGLLGKLDKDSGEAAAGMLGSLEAFDPKSTASLAGKLFYSKYQKATDSLVRAHVLPKALLGGDVAAIVDVEIIEGQNLLAADKGGTSDPYVKVTLGRSKFTTQVIYKNLNPKWLESHKLYVKKWPEGTDKCTMLLQVYDRDRSMRDDFLGEAEVDILQLNDAHAHELVLPLKKAKTGSIRITVKVIDLEAAAADAPDPTPQDTEIKGSNSGENEKELAEARWAKSAPIAGKPVATLPFKANDDYSNPGVLTSNKTPAGVSSGAVMEVTTGPADPPARSFVKVEIIEAQDLEAKDLSGTSDPFVKGMIGSIQFSTKHINKSLNPKWYDSFKLPIVEWHSDSTLLTLDVFDRNSMIANASIGRCIINMNKFRDGMRHDMWLRLENAKSGKIHVAITDLEDTMEIRSEILEVIPGLVVESWKVQSEHMKQSKNVAA